MRIIESFSIPILLVSSLLLVTPTQAEDKPLTLLQAVEITIENSPTIIQQRLNVDIARAQERLNAGLFDVNVSAGVNYGHNGVYSPPAIRTKDLSTDAGLSKLFRSGISTSLLASVSRSDISSLPEEAAPTSNTSSVTFSITAPLLKGRGSTSAAADETASRLEKEASIAGFQHVIAGTILGTVNAYWDYTAAVEKLALHEEAERRVRELQKTVGTGNSPGQKRLKGYLADKQSAIAQAQQELNTTRSQLASNMGIASDQLNTINIANTKLELDIDETLAKFEELPLLTRWQTIAEAQRMDLKAAKLRQQSAAVKLAKARRDVLPQLDLTFSTGYTGSSDGDNTSDYFKSLRTHVPGSNTSIGLNFSYPIGNNTARALVDLNNALNKQAVIGVNEQLRQLQLELNESFGVVLGNVKTFKNTTETMVSYLDTLSALDSKTLTSMGTIFYFLEFEKELTEAIENQVDSIQNLAKSVADVRFKTGTLIKSAEDGNISAVNLADLTSLPNM